MFVTAIERFINHPSLRKILRAVKRAMASCVINKHSIPDVAQTERIASFPLSCFLSGTVT